VCYAQTLEFLACGAAGNKPEGIASDMNGKISCINEGSAMDPVTLLDIEVRVTQPNAFPPLPALQLCGCAWSHATACVPTAAQGSMTMCIAEAPGGVFSVSCETKDIEKDNFVEGKWRHAVEYRVDGVRLYGPNGNNITYDVEPEGGAFTEDGLYQLVVMQDNDAYAMYDVAAGKYLFMGGFSGMASNSTLDGSDKDDKINIHSVASKPLTMPDQVTSFTHNGEYYFITANEGGSRDDSDGLLGASGEWEGEEIRMGDIPGCTGALCDDAELGRVLTTGYMPSDYAINACGNNLCASDGLDSGGDGDDGPIRPHVKGAGAFRCIFPDADYGGCGAICNIHEDHYEWADASGSTTWGCADSCAPHLASQPTPILHFFHPLLLPRLVVCSDGFCDGDGYPTMLAHLVDSTEDNAYYGPNCTVNNCDTDGFSFAGFAVENGVYPELRENISSPNPLGYDSAAVCQELCETYVTADGRHCDHFYSSYEMDKFECWLKDSYSDMAMSEDCHEYTFLNSKYDYSLDHQQGAASKPFVYEGYASWVRDCPVPCLRRSCALTVLPCACACLLCIRAARRRRSASRPRRTRRWPRTSPRAPARRVARGRSVAARSPSTSGTARPTRSRSWPTRAACSR
jgi:hypothetical protein